MDLYGFLTAVRPTLTAFRCPACTPPVSGTSIRGGATLRTRQRPRKRPKQTLDSLWRTSGAPCRERLFPHVCRGVHAADRGGLRTARSDPAGSRTAVTQNIIGLVLAVGVALYVLAALLFPERF
ncbi:potassium-transporting ATPase subunit F [Nocardia wallacei]|uniref:potassium-transporting ATPase subunit F n=1 Tax=Nocardia wallacei TaxID=480035 RepID=UPI001656E8BC|nr:potassium-transporting ATPase subunit F [Nocardia wallacei]